MTDQRPPVIQLQAMSLQMPDVAGHPNRLPFSGVLTRVGLASDSPPSGSNGKRVLITAEAAERALPSLMGMGINLTENMDGHLPTAKIGIITEAHVVGSDLMIAGFIYSSDHPLQAKKILTEQNQLGMSFEARNLTVEAADADPLVVTDLMFTGASVLLKSAAAYKTTRLAAMAAMAAIEKDDFTMTSEEMKLVLDQALAGALAPVNTSLADLQASHTALETRVSKFGEHIEAQQALVAKVEPAALSLEKTAAAIEASGVGTDADTGHAAVLRRMASAMRADAAAGRTPTAYTPVQAPVQVQAQAPAPKFEDSDAYKAMQAQIDAMTKVVAAAADKQAAAETKMADMQAQAALAKPSPDRKTLPPIIANLVAKAGIEFPDDGSMMSHGRLNKVLAESGLSTDQRMHLKTGLAKAGMVSLNATTEQ